MTNTLTIEGLFARYLEIKGQDLTGKQAYEVLYNEHFDKYGVEIRYTTYNSFRKNMSEYFRKKRLKKAST